jgi:hypothetical protein
MIIDDKTAAAFVLSVTAICHSWPQTERQDTRVADQWSLRQMRLSTCLDIDRRWATVGPTRFSLRRLERIARGYNKLHKLCGPSWMKEAGTLKY